MKYCTVRPTRSCQSASGSGRPSLPGDIFDVALAGRTLYAQSGAFLTSSPEIEVDTKWGGAKTFFSKEGFFLLKLSGTGSVFLSSYGAIHEIQLEAGQNPDSIAKRRRVSRLADPPDPPSRRRRSLEDFSPVKRSGHEVGV